MRIWILFVALLMSLGGVGSPDDRTNEEKGMGQSLQVSNSTFCGKLGGSITMVWTLVKEESTDVIQN